jgi:hypothetical protein
MSANPSSLGGGPYQGYSPQQTITNYKDSEQTMIRGVLRRSWNNTNINGNINGNKRIITPFRAVNNLGDYLGRQNYVCGGPNQVSANKPGWKGHIGSILSACDNTGVAASVTNNRFVPDSSDYITFKKQRAISQNYNDLGYGGDQSNASYVNRMAVRRR